MGPYGPNVATELEAALAADLSGGSGGAEPPQLTTHGSGGRRERGEEVGGAGGGRPQLRLDNIKGGLLCQV